MAVDTRLKRQSATCLLMPHMLIGAHPDTVGVVAAERLGITWMYAGIPAGGDVNDAATVAALTLATYSAEVEAANEVEAATETLELATYSAEVEAAAEVAAGVAALNLATYQAEVEAAAEVAATTATLELATYQADVALGINVLRR